MKLSQERNKVAIILIEDNISVIIRLNNALVDSKEATLSEISGNAITITKSITLFNASKMFKPVKGCSNELTQQEIAAITHSLNGQVNLQEKSYKLHVYSIMHHLSL